MPNCFQLYRKSDQTTALPLNTVVDVEIAQHLGVDVHPKLWCWDWYHVIGFLIACKDGCELGSDKLRQEVRDWYDDADGIYRQSVAFGKMTEAERIDLRENMLRILDFMESQYVSNVWVQIGKRVTGA